MKSYRYGFRNNYRNSMPLAEILWKDLLDFFKCIYYRLHHQGQLPTIAVYPDYPSKKTTIYKIAKNLKYRITNKPIAADVVVYFEDVTFGNTTDLERYYANYPVINRHCIDISKQKVEAVHHEIFGYNTQIDPLQYRGLALVKSNENAMHDGAAIACPISEKDETKVYQIIIDNTCNEHEVVDMRVPVYRNSIPLVYQKFKKMDVRYTNVVHHTTQHATDELLSQSEQELILAFTKNMGADWCELDILRHKGDGRIYIVDLNKTPYGPPAELAGKKEAIALLTAVFRSELM
jgi:hypothetical protein